MVEVSIQRYVKDSDSAVAALLNSQICTCTEYVELLLCDVPVSEVLNRAKYISHLLHGVQFFTLMSLTTTPLTAGQQMLLQRMMASHVLTHEEAVKIFDHVNDTTDCRNIEECFRCINRQLKAGFGLEIVTASVDGTKYHAVVNLDADDEIAKMSFTVLLPPSEREYMRKVLETLVQEDDGMSNRMSLINLRNTLDPKYKMSIQEAENCIDKMTNQHWLTVPEEKENRRCSRNRTGYVIGPRSYLELHQLLEDFGLDKLPQRIYHRSN
jgi:hypothetical protein